MNLIFCQIIIFYNVFSTLGDVQHIGDTMSTLGDIMSTLGVLSTSGRHHEYIRGCSVCRDTMSTSEGYHEYTWGVQYIGGYHEYIRGCSVHWGDIMMHVRDV